MRDIPANKAAFYLVSAREPDQAYFMIGYPIAFLAKLYEATADGAYLKAARGYLDFGLACEGNLRSFHTSHKVAWGAAVLARITGDPRCMELVVIIADHLLGIQAPSGAWLVDQPAHTTFDQPPKLQFGAGDQRRTLTLQQSGIDQETLTPPCPGVTTPGPPDHRAGPPIDRQSAGAKPRTTPLPGVCVD